MCRQENPQPSLRRSPPGGPSGHPHDDGVALPAAPAQAGGADAATAARSSFTSVSTMRLPDIPMGWPRAMAPPLTLTTSGPIRGRAMDASATAANASLISKRSTSAIPRPARCRRSQDGARRLGQQRRVGPGDLSVADDLGERLEARSSATSADDEHEGRPAVGDLAGVAGGDGPVGGRTPAGGRRGSRRSCRAGCPRRSPTGAGRPGAGAPRRRRSRRPARRPWWRRAARSWEAAANSSWRSRRVRRARPCSGRCSPPSRSCRTCTTGRRGHGVHAWTCPKR